MVGKRALFLIFVIYEISGITGGRMRDFGKNFERNTMPYGRTKRLPKFKQQGKVSKCLFLSIHMSKNFQNFIRDAKQGEKQVRYSDKLPDMR